VESEGEERRSLRSGEIRRCSEGAEEGEKSWRRTLAP